MSTFLEMRKVYSLRRKWKTSLVRKIRIVQRCACETAEHLTTNPGSALAQEPAGNTSNWNKRKKKGWHYQGEWERCLRQNEIFDCYGIIVFLFRLALAHLFPDSTYSLNNYYMCVHVFLNLFPSGAVRYLSVRVASHAYSNPTLGSDEDTFSHFLPSLSLSLSPKCSVKKCG